MITVRTIQVGSDWSRHTSISIAREVAGPLDIGVVLVLARGDGEEADGAQGGRVAEVGIGGDDRVGDVVVDGLERDLLMRHALAGSTVMNDGMADRVLLLLDLEDGAVLEGPLDDVGVGRGALDELALVEFGPEFGEILELDEVPDVGEGRLDDDGLDDRGGGRDAGGGIHYVRDGARLRGS